jgi:predicted O-methyltransferase YrrM
MVRRPAWLRWALGRGSKRLEALINVLRRREFPAFCCVSEANQETIDFVTGTQSRVIAEIGVYQGHTSELFARYLGGRGELHLFDFEERVREVAAKLEAAGYRNVVSHANSHKTMDSYNWSLMRVLQVHPEPIYDYVLLDGAHTWQLDALAFLLVDRLLKVGGYIDFDDYGWTLARSPSMNPGVFPATRRLYTPEQIAEAHVRLVVELLVRRDVRYIEVVENKIYQKVGSAP